MKRPLFFNKQRPAEEESEESEAATEDEEDTVSKLHEESVNKGSLIGRTASTNSEDQEIDEEMEEDAQEVESQVYK